MKIIRCINTDDDTVYAAYKEDKNLYKIEGNIFENFVVTNQKVEVKKLLAPFKPTSIICIGLNYKYHAEESGLPIPKIPVMFTKGINTVQNPNDPIEIPTHLKSEEVDYECELGVIIGKEAKNVSKENALDYVLGYTCVNDVSARDWQIKYGGGQWCRGKFFDTFAPIGPCLVTKEDIPNPNALGIRTILNGKSVQDWNTDDMIFKIPELIEFLSGSTTLFPGTLILTGTPHGVGMASKPPRWLKPGDNVSIEIDKIGILTNPVILERT